MDNGQAAAWIPDGYTQTAYLKPVPGQYPAVRFSFRPILVMMQADINREIADADRDFKKHQWIAAKWITQHIVTWNIKKPNGDRVSHSAIEEVLKLRPLLFTRIWSIINGTDAGDIDDEQAPFEMHAQAQREMAVAVSGESTEVTMEKN